MSQVVDTKLYDILNVSPTANEIDIKKAFKKLALEWHPDKWTKASDEEKQIAKEKFQEIQEAYGILADEEKKQMYDRYGYDAIKENGGGPQMSEEMLEEILSEMGRFGIPGMNFGHRSGKHGKKEMTIPNVEKVIKLTLKDIYLGSTIEFEITRHILKENKQPSKNDMICSKCKGQGSAMKLRQIGPGMVQQVMQMCQSCSGNGMIFPDEFFEKKTHTVSKIIPRGIMNKQRIVIKNKGNDIPNCFADKFPNCKKTDIVLTVSEEEDFVIDEYRYTRGINGSPFNMRLDINIEAHEAICGTYKIVPFLNNEKICIKIPSGVIFKKGDNAIVLPNNGLPYYKMDNKYGVLFVMLNVKDTFNPNENVRKQIWNLLTGKSMEKDHKDILQQTNNKFVDGMYLEQFKNSDEARKKVDYLHEFDNIMRNELEEENDEDDDHHGGHHGAFSGVPNCAQQ
jgi:DnaJ-class molecular chaperone